MANQHDEMLREAAKHGRLAGHLARKHDIPAELVVKTAKVAARAAFLAKPWLRPSNDEE